MRLYEVASGAYPYTRMSYELADVLNPKMTDLIVDEVEKVNIHEKTVDLKNHGAIAYDYCVLGLGFVLSDMGVRGAKENALPMSNVKEAEAIRDHIYAEMKYTSKTAILSIYQLSFVVQASKQLNLLVL